MMAKAREVPAYEPFGCPVCGRATDRKRGDMAVPLCNHMQANVRGVPMVRLSLNCAECGAEWIGGYRVHEEGCFLGEQESAVTAKEPSGDH